MAKNIFSYHTHSNFCDGKATMEQVCQQALELKMSALAFTSHAPVPFANTYSLRFEKLMAYKEEFNRLKALYGNDIELYLGLEADYIPGETVSFAEWKKILNLDFIIGSVHLVKEPISGKKWFIDGAPENYEKGLKEVYHYDIRRGVSDYFHQVREMIRIEKPDIIGHIDKVKMNNRDRYFSIDTPWYLDDFTHTLNVVKEIGGVVEINSRGIYRGKYHECFPHINGIRQCIQMGIPLTLASDSHQPDELMHGFKLALDVALQAGVTDVSMFKNGCWETSKIDGFLTETSEQKTSNKQLS